MRGLAFYSHAVAAAAFPGLVLAAGSRVSPRCSARWAAAALVALGVGGLSARRHPGYDVMTALALVGALVVGVILASNVFHSGSEVDTLLFGSLFAIAGRDLVFAARRLDRRAARHARCSARAGWPPASIRSAARAVGARSRLPDLALLVLVGFAAVAALAAVGALLATALLVVPAVTTRLWTDRVAALAARDGRARGRRRRRRRLALRAHQCPARGHDRDACGRGLPGFGPLERTPMRTRIALTALLLGVAVAACGGDDQPAADGGRCRQGGAASVRSWS